MSEKTVKYTVNKVASLSGLSIRALHYYDEIGLLKPSEVTPSAYRLYHKKDFERLQQILFFREMGLELKEIKKIVDSPSFNPIDALNKHKELLRLKRDRLNSLIELADKRLEGEAAMSFQEFDMTQIEEVQKKYTQEAKARWGQTDFYKESIKRTRSYSEQDWERINAQASSIYEAFAKIMGEPPHNNEAQQLVGAWQQYLTQYFYNCTKDVLEALGQLYVSDQRFTEKIDKHGQGLAKFMSQAIEVFCQ